MALFPNRRRKVKRGNRLDRGHIRKRTTATSNNSKQKPGKKVVIQRGKNKQNGKTPSPYTRTYKYHENEEKKKRVPNTVKDYMTIREQRPQHCSRLFREGGQTHTENLQKKKRLETPLIACLFTFTCKKKKRHGLTVIVIFLMMCFLFAGRQVLFHIFGKMRRRLHFR